MQSKRKVLVTKKVWSQGYSKPPIIEEVGIGKFHCWGCNCEESESNFGNYSIAIVEMPDGSILTTPPENIKFLDNKNDLLETLEHQLSVQEKIFSYLNSWANNEHMKQYARVDLEGIIAQVYADLAQEFNELKNTVNKAKGVNV